MLWTTWLVAVASGFTNLGRARQEQGMSPRPLARQRDFALCSQQVIKQVTHTSSLIINPITYFVEII